jgi:hypothetical protein
MAEQLILTVPFTPPSRASYSVSVLLLDFPNAVIRATLLGSDNEVVNVEWTGAVATALMIALNKANLTANSLQRHKP